MAIVENILAFLQRRRTAYRAVFHNPMGEEVLRDLAKFCRAHESTFHTDPRAHAVLEGRREVFLRIARHLHLDDDKLYEYYAGRSAAKE